VGAGRAGERRGDGVLALEPPGDHGGVLFADAPLSKLRGDGRDRAARLGRDKEAAGALVEPVAWRRAEQRVVRARGRQHVGEPALDGSRLPGEAVAVRHHARRLDHDRHVVVLEQHVQVERLLALRVQPGLRAALHQQRFAPTHTHARAQLRHRLREDLAAPERLPRR
jgi:hypothetical protein